MDPNRIAVLPFRVTAADTLLGEGFAELLAPEFTGVGGPRSVQMSTALNAWRRAGGGLRSPLTQEAARQLARNLGAGVLCEGSIVGIGGRLTVNAALVDATSGRPIGTPARATGTVDSIETLLSQIATTLLGAGARQRTADAGQLTKSPAALRSYFEGLALRRRGNNLAAGVAFEASFAADTMFASAAFERWLIAALVAGSPVWEARTLALRARLTPSERMIVNGQFGANAGVTRTRAQVHADMARAALQVDSPEAWYLYGDRVFHDGLPVVGPDSVLPLARAAFERALALDSQPISVGHLLTIALRTRDTALVRRLGRYLDRLESESRWARSWVAAGVLGDAAQLAKLRQEGPQHQAAQLGAGGLMDGLDSRIPTALIAEGFQHVNAVAGATERERNAAFLWLVHRARGQPLAAERSWAGQTPPHWRVSLGGGSWPAFSGDVGDDSEFMRQFGAGAQAPAAESRRQCVVARLQAQRGHADSIDIAALRPRTNERCARVLEIWKAFAANALTDAMLTELDSIVTASVVATFMGFEHRFLASVYESRGDTVRALRAIRLYPRDFPAAWLTPTRREEGRAYLMARDTASAVRSYSVYLELRAEAEAPYVAERDSIRALVAALSRRR